MTELDTYQPAAIGQYQAGIIMDVESVKALDEQVRLCTAAVLREGTDYGIIPGTNGEKSLWRPGAQKLLQWFRLECTCERIEVERDDDGRKHGITYRAEVGRGLKTATPVILATCEGTADYDESKFHQSAEEVQRKARDRETKWAEKDRRARNPEKWKDLPEYRADWNALMKRAQKRAIVGAVNDATAAGGIFTDREEDDHAPVTEDGEPSWYEQALERAADVTDSEDGNALYVEAADAHKKGWCSRKQQDTIQNILKKRARLLKKATVVVEAEDLATQAGRLVSGGVSVRRPAAEDDARSQPPDADPAPARDGDGGSTAREPAPRAAGAAPDRGTQPPPPQDGPAGLEPGEAAEYGTERHRKVVGIVWGHLQRLGYPGDSKEADEEKATRLADVAKLAGVSEIGSTNDLDLGELSLVADALARCKDRKALDALLKAGEVDD